MTTRTTQKSNPLSLLPAPPPFLSKSFTKKRRKRKIYKWKTKRKRKRMKKSTQNQNLYREQGTRYLPHLPSPASRDLHSSSPKLPESLPESTARPKKETTNIFFFFFVRQKSHLNSNPLFLAASTTESPSPFVFARLSQDCQSFKEKGCTETACR